MSYAKQGLGIIIIGGKPVVPYSLRDLRPKPQALGGFTVSAGEIDILDGKMRNLDSDIRAFAGPSLFLPGSTSINPGWLSWNSFRNGEWLMLMPQWTQWNATHQTVLSQTGDAVAGEFAAWIGKYNEALRRFQEFGGKTQATAVAPGSSAIGQLLSELPWGKIALVAGAIVGGYWLLNMGGTLVLKKALLHGGAR